MIEWHYYVNNIHWILEMDLSQLEFSWDKMDSSPVQLGLNSVTHGSNSKFSFSLVFSPFLFFEVVSKVGHLDNQVHFVIKDRWTKTYFTLSDIFYNLFLGLRKVKSKLICREYYGLRAEMKQFIESSLIVNMFNYNTWKYSFLQLSLMY